MALIEPKWNPTSRDLRVFTAIWSVFFSFISAMLWWRYHAPIWATVVFCLTVPIGLFGLMRPSAMRLIYVLWITLTFPIGWTVSHLILLFIFYIVLTPVALIMRAVGYNPMARRFDRACDSYWTEHDPGTDKSRYFRQM